jgi:tRNA (adenine57-N1/adenine58-N1)-methyltransferase
MVVKMPRGAQVIYPKDIGPIMTLADVRPGTRLLEAGVGSGGLSMGLVRAGAIVKGYELREDFAQIARDNVARFCGAQSANFDVEIRDVYEGIDETGLDAIILDLPEPWQVVAHAEKALRSGGLIVSYVPSTTQIQRFRAALDDSRFGLVRTIEIMERGWYINGDAVRPDHRMVAHTGFLTVGRLLADSAGPPNEKMPFVRA